jgi:hypothetical protein
LLLVDRRVHSDLVSFAPFDIQFDLFPQRHQWWRQSRDKPLDIITQK